MVKLGLDNSRMKDFYDLWLLARDYKFDDAVLANAVKATFARRKTQLPETTPVALTEEFYNAASKRQQWKAFLNKGQFTEREEEFGAVCHRIKMFIMPVVEAIVVSLTLLYIWLFFRRYVELVLSRQKYAGSGYDWQGSLQWL